MDYIIDKIILEDAMSKLDEKERYVIQKRYLDGVNQYDLANCMDINRASLSRIEKRAILKLKHFVKS